EWAYDCADVRPTMKQSRAPVYRSYPVTRGDARCEGHDYAARLRLPTAIEIERIEIQWTGGAGGTLSVKKISVLNEAERSSAPVVPLAGSLADATRWRHVLDINFANSGYGAIKPEDVGEASVYENLRARPRAWLVGKVLRVTEEEALAALHSSRLADGSVFDPAEVALVEAPHGFTAQALDGEGASARVTHLSDGRMEVETRASAPAFLVTSDVYYPGWEATVDGVPAPLFRADYALRGLPVPAGTHRVRFEFRPRSFERGLCVSAASLLLLAASLWWMNRKAARRARTG
ncbi:MAG TPA: YfhO family protein, partial [Pyrinomonadaceae bacterium]